MEEENFGIDSRLKNKKKIRPINTTNCCAISSCSSPSGIPYKLFPKEPLIQEKWISACRRTDVINVKTARICMNHFSEDSFQRDLTNELLGLPSRKKLKTDAIPTLNLTEPSSKDRVNFGPDKPKNLAEIDDYLVRLSPVAKDDLKCTKTSEIKRKELVKSILNAEKPLSYFFQSKSNEALGKEKPFLDINTNINVNFYGSVPTEKKSSSVQCSLVEESDYNRELETFNRLKKKLHAEKVIQKKLKEKIIRSERNFYKEETVRKFLMKKFNATQTKYIMGEIESEKTLKQICQSSN